MSPYQNLNKVEETYHGYPYAMSTVHMQIFIKHNPSQKFTKTKSWKDLKEANECIHRCFANL